MIGWVGCIFRIRVRVRVRARVRVRVRVGLRSGLVFGLELGLGLGLGLGLRSGFEFFAWLAYMPWRSVSLCSEPNQLKTSVFKTEPRA